MIIVGVDEAGRGPWAGPLVAAVCCLPKNCRLKGLNDSKKLTEKAREKLFEMIIKKADYGIGVADVREVEKGMVKALNLAIERALLGLKVTPDLLLIDGKDKFNLKYSYKTIIRGDQKERAIMAASILAKVTRDRIMEDLGKKHPLYRFEEHKGYGTRIHRELIVHHGICEIHRKNFYIKELGMVLGQISSPKLSL
ncbi:MAG: ribonuclease HII [Candidatus Gracilibacteria bacterium]